MSTTPDAAEIRRRITRQLGPDATEDMVESVLSRVLELGTESGETAGAPTGPAPMSPDGDGRDRLIISVFGVNQPGIVAGVSQILARHECNILDISQKLMQEFFTMILVVDLAGPDATFELLQGEFDQLSGQLGIKIYTQHEEVFRALNRL